MYDYILGEVVGFKSDAVVIDNNGIGYLIYTPNPFVFKEGEKIKVYLYQKITEDGNSLYGFKREEDKYLFLKLINVKGVGPKTALPIIATGSVKGIVSAIEREDVNYLKKFPKIGDKVARQIILDLKGKLKDFETDHLYEAHNDDLFEVLKSLGYKDKEIRVVIERVDKNLSLEEQVKEALKLLTN